MFLLELLTATESLPRDFCRSRVKTHLDYLKLRVCDPGHNPFYLKTFHTFRTHWSRGRNHESTLSSNVLGMGCFHQPSLPNSRRHPHRYQR